MEPGQIVPLYMNWARDTIFVGWVELIAFQGHATYWNDRGILGEQWTGKPLRQRLRASLPRGASPVLYPSGPEGLVPGVFTFRTDGKGNAYYLYAPLKGLTGQQTGWPYSSNPDGAGQQK